jgi:SpoVK/Ycf46/Vps4 family AAA+-type ATPase
MTKNTMPFATKIISRPKWNELVLPNAKKKQLLEICNRVKLASNASEPGGFDSQKRDSGLYVLFSGPSGTGKTMAAAIIAGELDLDLYKIDLCMLVSKYIGETEKNLSTLFSAAELEGSLLFFDEADALFGKRSQVKDSHDRYSNIEINYLLQRLEAFHGLAIIATAPIKIDQAFARRMHFIVEFPYPTPEERLKIWKQAFPSEVPLSKIDFEGCQKRN